jgi:hypothetical protein
VTVCETWRGGCGFVVGGDGLAGVSTAVASVAGDTEAGAAQAASIHVAKLKISAKRRMMGVPFDVE